MSLVSSEVSPDYAALAKIAGLTTSEYQQALARVQSGDVPKRHLRPVQNRYTQKIKLFPKQVAFSLLPQQEAVAHGAGNSGKTSLAIYNALQYSHVPGYSALILRRTYKQLNMANSVLDRFHRVLGKRGYRWNHNDHRAEFEEGSYLTFGHMDTESDMYRYDSAEFQFIGIDESVQFSQRMLEFIRLRLRYPRSLKNVPLRLRLYTNPGGISHLYHRNYFIETLDADRAQMPFYLEDNPFVDPAQYEKTIKNIDPILYRQRRNGDWYAQRVDCVIKRDWLRLVDNVPKGRRTRVRFWDLAATAPKKGRDPDYMVGTLMSRSDAGHYCVEDVQRFRLDPAQAEERFMETARADGRDVYIRIEEEGGASGKSYVNYLTRALPGHNVQGVKPDGPKLARWGPVAGQAKAGNVSVVTGAWASDWLNEVTNVTGTDDVHDDQMDSLAGSLLFFTDEMPTGAVGMMRLTKT